MTLPKIFNPTYDITVPSLKKTFKFRPFLVKEEKILLMAKESENYSDVLASILQVVSNCSVDNNFDINKIAIFDLNYIFLKIRSFSVDNICPITYEDPEDKKEYHFKVDLNTVEVEFPDKIQNKIAINDLTGLIMKYPMASLYNDNEYLSTNKDYLFETIVRCVDKIYDGDIIYEAKDYSTKEIADFLENLSSKIFAKIQEFVTNLPTIKQELKYTNSLGNEKTITLKSLSDFFTLR